MDGESSALEVGDTSSHYGKSGRIKLDFETQPPLPKNDTVHINFPKEVDFSLADVTPDRSLRQETKGEKSNATVSKIESRAGGPVSSAAPSGQKRQVPLDARPRNTSLKLTEDVLLQKKNIIKNEAKHATWISHKHSYKKKKKNI